MFDLLEKLLPQIAFEEPDPRGGNDEPSDPPSPDDQDEVSFEFPNVGDENDPDEPSGEPNDQLDLQKSLQALNEKLERIEKENEALRRAIPPAQPVQPQAPTQQTEEVDWGEKFYQDPNAAVNDIVTQAVQTAVQQVTSAYQKDQSTKDFWNQFYGANPDLSEDRDLVTMTLNTHMADLSPLPVPEAMSKLAALTRARIARYKEGGGKKVVVEGGGQPTGAPSAPRQRQQERPQTLSDVIRERRRKRASAA